MPISALDIAIIVCYLVAALGLGLYQAFKIKSSGDYYAGGRKFNKFYLMMHALGTATHADEPLSVIGSSYQKGIAGIWYTYLFLPLTPLFWLIAPYIRRTRFVTTADFFRYRYDESLAVLYSVIGVLKMSLSIGLILKSTATLFAAMISGGATETHVWAGMNIETWVILVMTVVFVSYGFAGGLRATVITETIQGPLIVLMSLLLLPFGIYKLGGFHVLHEALPDSFFHMASKSYEFTPQWVIASSRVALIGWVAQPGIVAAVGSGKTELEGRVGYTYGAMIKRVCAIGWTFTGVILAAMAAKQMLDPGQIESLGKGRELAFGVAVREFFPTGVLGLTFAAIFSSQMATLSAQMVNSSALASRNLYQAVIRPTAGDREVLVFGRIVGIFLVAIGVLLAMYLEKVADALTMLLQFSAIMGVVVWGGIFWRRANVSGAWAAVAVLFITWMLFGPVGAMISKAIDGPAWLGQYGKAEFMYELTIRYLPAGIATLIVVSLLTKRPPKKQVDDLRMLLRTPVGEEQKLIDADVKIIYAGSTTPNRLEIEHPDLVHWGGAALAAVVCAIILGLLLWLAQIGS
jgi:Na+/proline symporter